MKKVMILGAGSGQVPFINICKEKGYYVIVVSIEGDYPGFKLADKCYYYDTRDKENILKAAQEEQINAILTDQTDVSVPTVAYVSEQMGLKGIGYDTSLKFSNKFLMRKAAKKAGVAVPDFDETDNIEKAISIANRIGYPLMIKPVDSSGSRGVIKINSENELKDSFDFSKNYSSNNRVIMEQFIVGKEYLVDGISIDGTYINLDLGEKEYFDVPNVFVSKMCMFSSARIINNHVGNLVLEANKKLVESIGLNSAITHAEYLYDSEKDTVFLVEIAARGGGVYLSSHITPRASGIDTNTMLIENIVEDKHFDISSIHLKNNISGWVCFSFNDGVVTDITGVDETNDISGVYLIDLSNVCVGMKTKKLIDDSGKFGPVLFEGKTKEECYNIISKVRNTLRITTQKNGIDSDLIW